MHLPWCISGEDPLLCGFMETTPVRKGMRYWGPVLIVVGVVLIGLAISVLRDLALWWALSICSLFLLAGVSLIGASRLDDQPSTRTTNRP